MLNRSAILHRQASKSYLTAVSGHGPYLVTSDGRKFIDACGGAAVSSVGHNHPAVQAAIADSANRIDYIHTSFFTSDAAEALAIELVSQAPRGLTHVIPLSGGSEAVESALKLARQAAVERGEPHRRTVISRRQSYHGNTLGALAISGNVGRRALYDPLLFRAEFISPCFAYRYAQDGEDDVTYGRRSADELETKIIELGPETVLAFVMETVVGATSGAVAPSQGYLKRIREICNTYGVTLILDEIMCGMGRTGTLHACEQEDVSPDIMVVAKGLGGGAVPIAAVYLSEQIFDAIVSGSGALQNGFTYMGHPLSCAVALAVQRTIRAENLVENVRSKGARLKQGLMEALGSHPFVGDIRGRGLFLALEFVQDKATRRPFDPHLKIHESVKEAAMDVGLLIYAMAGTADGVLGNHVMLAPPYIIDDDIVDCIVDKLARAVETSFKRVAAA